MHAAVNLKPIDMKHLRRLAFSAQCLAALVLGACLGLSLLLIVRITFDFVVGSADILLSR